MKRSLTAAYFCVVGLLTASAAHAGIPVVAPEASTNVSFGVMLALGAGIAFLAYRKKSKATN